MFGRQEKSEMSPSVTAKVSKEGALMVTVNGKARTVAPKAVARAWVLKGEKAVVYSVREMKHGYEGEGEALFRYDVATGQTRRLMTAAVMVDKVYELTTAGGKSLLCVTLSDGGLGANHVALVNPERGVVFANTRARFVKVEPRQIVVAEWKDFNRWHGAEEPRGKPNRLISLDPDRVLSRRPFNDRPWF
jgi:hypothetical protein